MNRHDLEDLAKRQLADYDRHDPGTAFAEGLELTIDEAYRLQQLVADLRVARGDEIIGYKVGCTSPAIQKRFGIDHPVFGRLFEPDRYSTESMIPASRFCNLAIEGELAVRVGKQLASAGAKPLSENDDEIFFPVIELHNLVFRGNRPSAPELIASNALHAGFVHAVGYREAGLLNGSLRISVGGTVVAEVADMEQGRSFVHSMAWLRETLESQGIPLREGQVVLCGSVADLFPVSTGQVKVTMTQFDFGRGPTWDVECTIEG